MNSENSLNYLTNDILICNYVPSITDNIMNILTFLQWTPKIFIMDNCKEDNEYSQNIHFLNLDPGSKNFKTEVMNYKKTLSFIKYIFILAKDPYTPDIKTQHIIKSFTCLFNEKEIWQEKPLLFCEIVDNANYESFKKNSDGVFCKTNLLAIAMAYISYMQHQNKDWLNKLKLFEKGEIKHQSIFSNTIKTIKKIIMKK